MAGKPVTNELQVNLENWDSPPQMRWAFNHCNQFMPTATIARDEKNMLHFAEQKQDIEAINFTDSKGRATSVKQYLDHGFIDGFLVYHRGKIIFEKYHSFTNAASCHLLQSVTKSVIGAVGQKLKAEKILRGDMLIESILPEMNNTGYAGATVQQAMDMRSGIEFKQDYYEFPIDDTSGDSYALDIANGWKGNDGSYPRDNFALLQTLKKISFPHGEQMVYRCVEADVVTHCFEKLTGKKIADLISEFLWRPMGAGANGYITLDPSGFGIGSGGLCARARDILAFGVMMAEDGFINDKQVLTESLVAECYNPAPYKFDKTNPALAPGGGYKNFFWINDVTPPHISCFGVYGQMVSIDKKNNLVMVMVSTWPTPEHDDGWKNPLLMTAAITRDIA